MIRQGELLMAFERTSRRRVTAEERRAAIIAAAVSLFSRQGFAHTTTREIATEAGIAEGTIYSYFASKQEILLAFIEPAALHDFPSLFRPGVALDDHAVISRFILNRLQLFHDNRQLLRVVFGEALHTPELADSLRSMIRPAFSVMEEYVTQRIRAGAFRAGDASLPARALIGLVLGYFFQTFLIFNDEADAAVLPRVAHELTELYLHGVQCCPQSEDA